MFNKVIYYKYPATWCKIHFLKIEKFFNFTFKFHSLGCFHLYLHTPIIHFHKDNANLYFGPSFGKYQFSLHFHW